MLWLTSLLRPLLRQEIGPSRKQVKEAYVSTFLSPAGRIVLEDLMRHNFLADTVVQFGDQTVDPLMTAYNEGRRQVVLAILGEVEIALISEQAKEEDDE